MSIINIIFLLTHEKMSGNPTIKVARPGYDVTNAEDKNLALSSEFITPKIARIIHFTTNGSVAHGLGYVPMFLGYYLDSGSWYPAVNGYVGGGTPYFEIDDTDITLLNSVEAYVILFTDALET